MPSMARRVGERCRACQIAGTLVQKTSSLGLSLGDRACLALAIALDAPVYTTDRLWKKLKLSIPIYLLR